MTSTQLAEKIDAVLPQTQCTQCGYQGCLPYAEAISQGKADINQCPPGGAKGIKKIAALLNVEFKPLNPDYGVEQERKVAFIIEKDCIGCTKCLPPCPVDAIIGANKFMHTVIQAECTGCELCISPCPVDCIVMQPLTPPTEWTQKAADHAKNRYQAKLKRQEQRAKEKVNRLKRQKQLLAKINPKNRPNTD